MPKFGQRRKGKEDELRQKAIGLHPKYERERWKGDVADRKKEKAVAECARSPPRTEKRGCTKTQRAEE